MPMQVMLNDGGWMQKRDIRLMDFAATGYGECRNGRLCSRVRVTEWFCCE